MKQVDAYENDKKTRLIELQRYLVARTKFGVHPECATQYARYIY